MITTTLDHPGGVHSVGLAAPGLGAKWWRLALEAEDYAELLRLEEAKSMWHDKRPHMGYVHEENM